MTIFISAWVIDFLLVAFSIWAIWMIITIIGVTYYWFKVLK